MDMVRRVMNVMGRDGMGRDLLVEDAVVAVGVERTDFVVEAADVGD
jgi:hypothetical protein